MIQSEPVPSSVVARTGRAGNARLAFERVGNRTVVRTALAHSPLRLLTPRNHGHAAWVYTNSLGGGLVCVESGGDNLAAQYSRELADYTLYVIDVAGGDKVPRKGGPGITQSDLLIINKTDLAPHVGADLSVMERDARKMRGDGPFVFTQVTTASA